VKPEWFRWRLRELRAAAGLTQAQLGEGCGLHEKSIAQLETGRREPTWATALALAAALGVPCDAFARKPAAQEEPGRGRPSKARPERRPPEPRACRHCGTVFQPKRVTAMFCRPRCQVAAYRAKMAKPGRPRKGKGK